MSPYSLSKVSDSSLIDEKNIIKTKISESSSPISMAVGTL